MYDSELIKYFKHPGLNSSLLGAFAEDPLVAIQKSKSKSYFEEGKAFERLFQDKITGSSRFSERFYVCEDIKIPESYIDVFKSSKPLTEFFVFTQKGEFNKQKDSLHEVLYQSLLDELYFSNGVRRYPIPLSDYKAMELSIDRLMNMPIELFNGVEFILKDLIDGNTLFQYPIYWKSGEIEKKALFDMITFFEYDGHGWVLPLDLKFMANLSGMYQMFRRTKDKYCIQSAHYSEGLWFVEEFEGLRIYEQMPFIVATKTDPYYVQPFMMQPDSIDYVLEDYRQLCYDCKKWLDEGKPTTGIKKTAKVKIWRS